jgi:hypothetical protein
VGAAVGAAVGTDVGAAVGVAVGDTVGDTVFAHSCRSSVRSSDSLWLRCVTSSGYPAGHSHLYSAPPVAVHVAFGCPSSVFIQHQCVPASQWWCVGADVGTAVGAVVGTTVGEVAVGVAVGALDASQAWRSSG